MVVPHNNPIIILTSMLQVSVEAFLSSKLNPLVDPPVDLRMRTPLHCAAVAGKYVRCSRTTCVYDASSLASISLTYSHDEWPISSSVKQP